MAQADPMKWSLPGWRIEQKYANGVLIGNWNEARKTVSTHIFKKKLNLSLCLFVSSLTLRTDIVILIVKVIMPQTKSFNYYR